MIICVKGIKIGDSVLKLEDGTLQCIYPDTHYVRGHEGYWMLQKIDPYWKIIRVLLV